MGKSHNKRIELLENESILLSLYPFYTPGNVFSSLLGHSLAWSAITSNLEKEYATVSTITSSSNEENPIMREGLMLSIETIEAAWDLLRGFQVLHSTCVRAHMGATAYNSYSETSTLLVLDSAGQFGSH